MYSFAFEVLRYDDTGLSLCGFGRSRFVRAVVLLLRRVELVEFLRLLALLDFFIFRGQGVAYDRVLGRLS